MWSWCISYAVAATLEVVAAPAPGQFATVQDAVDAASAGDVVRVETGVFVGHVEIEEDLTLIGAGMDATVLRASTSAQPVVVVEGATVLVEDLTIDGVGLTGGMQLNGGADVELWRTKVRDGMASAGAGIRVGSSATAVVRQSVLCGNVASGYGGGVFISGGGFVDAQETLFVGNLCTGNAGGALHPDGQASLVNNTFVANEAVGGAAVGANGDVEFLNNLVIHHIATGTYPSGDQAVQSLGATYSGGSNLYFDNLGGDTEHPLPGDLFGVDPGVPSSFACDTLTLVDAALVAGSVAVDAGDPSGVFADIGALDFDADGDGFGIPEDCDDGDDARFPGAAEQCDGLDDDCDGEADEGLPIAWYFDEDGDGFGGSQGSDGCTSPGDGWVEAGGDCDDVDPYVSPEATEQACDGLDNDCDPATSDGSCPDTGDTGFTYTDTDTGTDVDADTGRGRKTVGSDGLEGLADACGCASLASGGTPWPWLVRRRACAAPR